MPYFDYKYTTNTILKLLPFSLQLALFKGNYIETFFDKYLSSNYSQVTYLLDSLFNFMSGQSEEAINCVLHKFVPYFNKSPNMPILYEPIISYQAVPYFLNAFNSKTNAHLMLEYFKLNPLTVIYETVYLLFTKQTNEPLKKAKKNAKLFFDYLIENYKTELIATLQAYDQQLDKPVLEPFLANDQAHQLALQHQDKTTVQHDIAQFDCRNVMSSFFVKKLDILTVNS